MTFSRFGSDRYADYWHEPDGATWHMTWLLLLAKGHMIVMALSGMGSFVSVIWSCLYWVLVGGWLCYIQERIQDEYRFGVVTRNVIWDQYMYLVLNYVEPFMLFIIVVWLKSGSLLICIACSHGIGFFWWSQYSWLGTMNLAMFGETVKRLRHSSSWPTHICWHRIPCYQNLYG